MTEVFKVVRRFKGVLGSLLYTDFAPHGLLTYKPKESTYPDIGKIMAFSHKNAALVFARSFNFYDNCTEEEGVEVWRAYGEIEEDLDPILIEPFYLQRLQTKEAAIALLEEAWIGGAISYPCRLSHVPMGTVYCNHLTLLEKINDRRCIQSSAGEGGGIGVSNK